MRKTRVIIACMAALAVMVSVQSAAAQGRLEGVWKLTEASMSGPDGFKDSNPGLNLLMFTKKYYSSAELRGDKPRPIQPLEQATDAQKVAVWELFDADAGTYDVKGTTLIMQGVVARDPDEMQAGKPHTFDFKIEGNTLFLTMKANEDGPLPNPLQMKLVRLE